jgi:uncharacterized protein YehS (DUF1456 family)
MIEIFKLADHGIEQSTLTSYFKKEDEEGFVKCGDIVMGCFLDGLILFKRGRKENKTGEPRKRDLRLTNNAILKKLRIALELKEDDLISVLKMAGAVISKSELSALFRNEGHKNFKPCGDQFLRKFLRGISIRYRS